MDLFLPRAAAALYADAPCALCGAPAKKYVNIFGNTIVEITMASAYTPVCSDKCLVHHDYPVHARRMVRERFSEKVLTKLLTKPLTSFAVMWQAHELFYVPSYLFSLARTLELPPPCLTEANYLRRFTDFVTVDPAMDDFYDVMGKLLAVLRK